MWDYESHGLTLIDFEFSGVLANPMVDITMFIVKYSPPEFSAAYERYLITRYWLGLIATGNVDPEVFTLE